MVSLLIVTLIGTAALALASTMALLLALRNATISYEDVQGFHGEIAPHKATAGKR